MIELKPCPFCGSKAKFHVDSSGIAVMCTWFKCECRTSRHEDVLGGKEDWRKSDTCAATKAAEEWNRRVKYGE